VTLADRARRLLDLHAGPGLLVLPNAWDAASARLVADAGFPVVATSSAAVAASLGHPDGEAMPADDAFAAVARIAAAVEVPVTADIEAGYSLDPTELVDRLLAADAVGCNLEDTDHHGPGDLVEADRNAERLGAVREAADAAGVHVVVNARVDVFRFGPPSADRLDDAIGRARLYLEAGADCVYPIRLSDAAAIRAFVEAIGAPVNVMAAPDAPPLARLRELGVRRVSYASGLHRSASAAVGSELARIAAELEAGSPNVRPR
jgi:2-methylisocitrate lyase-like PEP mutase family enzyme